MNFPRCSMLEAPKLSPWLLVWLKIWRNSCKMIADLRNNQSFEWSCSSHLHWICGLIEYMEVRCIANRPLKKKKNISCTSKSAWKFIFLVVASVIWDHLEANSETPNCRAAIFVFLFHQWLSVYKLAPGPLVLKKKPWIYLFSRAKIAQLKHNNHQMLKH